MEGFYTLPSSYTGLLLWVLPPDKAAETKYLPDKKVNCLPLGRSSFPSKGGSRNKIWEEGYQDCEGQMLRRSALCALGFVLSGVDGQRLPLICPGHRFTHPLIPPYNELPLHRALFSIPTTTHFTIKAAFPNRGVKPSTRSSLPRRLTDFLGSNRTNFRSLFLPWYIVRWYSSVKFFITLSRAFGIYSYPR